MRHRNKGVILDRLKGKRQALLRGLLTNFILYEKMDTTRAKAKAVKPIVERLITRARNKDIATQRYIAARVYTDGARRKLIEVLGPRYRERPGGYTRIIPLRQRLGDRAHIVRIEFV